VPASQHCRLTSGRAHRRRCPCRSPLPAPRTAPSAPAPRHRRLQGTCRAAGRVLCCYWRCQRCCLHCCRPPPACTGGTTPSGARRRCRRDTPAGCWGRARLRMRRAWRSRRPCRRTGPSSRAPRRRCRRRQLPARALQEGGASAREAVAAIPTGWLGHFMTFQSARLTSQDYNDYRRQHAPDMCTLAASVFGRKGHWHVRVRYQNSPAHPDMLPDANLPDALITAITCDAMRRLSSPRPTPPSLFLCAFAPRSLGGRRDGADH
jgi:hypothetical protein